MPRLDKTMSPRLKRTIIRAAAGVALALVLIWLMTALESVTTMLMVALILAYLLDPPVKRLAGWGLGRPLSAILVLLLGLGFVFALLLIVVPRALEEIADFSRRCPAYLTALQGLVFQLADRFSIGIPRDWDNLLSLLVARGRQFLPDIANVATKVMSSFFRSTIHIISGLIYLLLIPVIAYYLLASFDSIKTGVKELIPPYVRPPIISKLIEIDLVISGFVRGQLTIALLLGILYALGFVIIGIDLAVVLGIVSGVLFVIPYVGTLFGVIAGSLMALAKYGDLIHPLYVLLWIAGVQLLEGYVLTPRIVGKAIGLHPVVYIMALIIGGNLFGFAGMLVAIPVAAVLKVLLVSAVAAYRNSYLYNDVPGERP
jgi:predicted PurR-regulated permease PerM